MAWPARASTCSWRSGSGFAGGHAQLPLDEIEAGDRLGDGMLDLQARVHLHEIECAARIEQEFDRAGADIADGLRRRDGGCAHARAAMPASTRRRRRLLDRPSGGGAAPSSRARRDGRRCRGVGEDLDLDVARLSTIARSRISSPSPKAAVASERARAQARPATRSAVAHQPHARAAAPGRRLDHHRQADRLRLAQQHRVALLGALIARHARARPRRSCAAWRRLVAHRTDGGGRRPDEDQAGIAQAVAKSAFSDRKP